MIYFLAALTNNDGHMLLLFVEEIFQESAQDKCGKVLEGQRLGIAELKYIQTIGE